MPTYEYECTKCGHTFEAFQSMKDNPLSRCPKCKGSVRRIVSGGMGVIFKGSGFYSTDNKKGSALTGGNGGSREKEKTADQPKEASGDSNGSGKATSESSSTEKTAKEKTPAS
jgi:putative FmdB family regulatory protein